MYNNGFPVTYPQLTFPYQQPQQAQGMTRPTIHADIIQIETEQDELRTKVRWVYIN